MTTEETKQKFYMGDHVKILEPNLEGGPTDEEAMVREASSGQTGWRYALFVRYHGKSAWYDEEGLSLIGDGDGANLREWATEIRVHDDRVGDLDWIFQHGKEVLKEAEGATIATLAKCVKYPGDLWGSQGEGIAYWFNSMKVLKIAEPFLRTGDQKGFLAACETVKWEKKRLPEDTTQYEWRAKR